MVASSDAVVVGRVIAVAAGRAFGAPDPLQYAAATLAVESVLAGALPAGRETVLTLEIPLFGGLGELDDYRAALPMRGLFFLRNKGTSAAAAGLTAEQQLGEAAYYRLMTFDAVILEAAGRAAVGDARRYLEALSEVPFDEAVAAVRSAGR